MGTPIVSPICFFILEGNKRRFFGALRLALGAIKKPLKKEHFSKAIYCI